MRLFTWTGWTKEDWVEAIKFFSTVLVGTAFMWVFMFGIGYFS